MVLVELVAKAHVIELTHGSRGQAVATGLVSWEVLFLDDDNVVAGIGEPVSRC